MASNPNTLPGEEWRDVPGYEGLYQASSLGRVRRITRFRPCGGGKFEPSHFRILGQHTHKETGYNSVHLSNGRAKTLMVHRIVCETFHGPCPDKWACAAHNDGTRHNNRADNLRWDTPAGNAADRHKHGTHSQGEKHISAKLTADQVREIRQSFRPRYGDLERLARIHGVSSAQILNIVRRKQWTHI